MNVAMNTTSHLRRKVKGTITPPINRSPSDSSFNDSYFDKTYVPLSSLPTPPLSHSRSNSRQQSPASFSSDDVLDPELIGTIFPRFPIFHSRYLNIRLIFYITGPAIHLTNLIPSSTSLTTASVPLVHALLTRADLPLETLALAVAILDSLNSRFALQWRQGCPLDVLHLPPPFGNLNERLETQHIDSIHPEIIVLSALILAIKFLDDQQQPTREYAHDLGRGLWTCAQINYTQRCLLENLGYRLLPLWDDTIILEALEDMERASRQYEPEIYDDEEDADWKDLHIDHFCNRTMSSGKATYGLGHQITPIETPVCENIKGTRDVALETKRAFSQGGVMEVQLEENQMGEMEAFPLFMNQSAVLGF